DRTTSGRETTQGPTNHDGSEIGSDDNRNLPDVDEKETELEDGLPADLLTPRSPQLTPKSIRDEKDEGTAASSLLTDAKLLRDARNGVGVETGIEVHGGLHQKDNHDDCPFFPTRE